MASPSAARRPAGSAQRVQPPPSAGAGRGIGAAPDRMEAPPQPARRLSPPPPAAEAMAAPVIRGHRRLYLLLHIIPASGIIMFRPPAATAPTDRLQRHGRLFSMRTALHVWPAIASTSNRALIQLAQRLLTAAVRRHHPATSSIAVRRWTLAPLPIQTWDLASTRQAPGRVM